MLICALWAPLFSPGGAGGVQGEGGIGSGVHYLYRMGGGGRVPLSLQQFCGYIAVQFCQRSHPSLWFWRSMASCLSIAKFTIQCPGNQTPQFLPTRTSAWGFLIRYCVSLIVVRKNPPMAILATIKASRIWDCFSCTWPPCLVIAGDVLKTYKKLVAALYNELW